MLKVWGFAELKPEQKIIEEKIFEIVKKNYQKYGFTPIETPAVERTEVLTAKGGWEVGNQIFGVYGLAQGASDLKKYSLHFDLTVPFARYVLDYRGELTFPFKRSQIQKVWRGERQQRGRSREFYQADIDVVWEEQSPPSNSLPCKEGEQDIWTNLFYDAEVISIGYKTYLEIFQAFDLDLKIKININNKRIVSGFIAAIWLSEQFTEISQIIDKKDKIDVEAFKEELTNACRDVSLKHLVSEKTHLVDKNQNISTENVVQKIIDFTNIKAEYKNLENILELVNESEATELKRWITELKTVLKNIYALWIAEEDIIINLWIIRWLEYYTGTIFETFIEWDRKLWSIASGWRYEWLTKFLDKKSNYSGVGFSMWITRFEDYLFEQLDLANLPKTTSEYLIINFEDTQTESLTLYQKLASEGKKVEYYPEASKLKKQFRYADEKGIKYCVLLGSGELEKGAYTVKNMATWESEEVNLSE